MSNRLPLDDPMPETPPRPGFQWARNEFGWCQERAPKRKSETPHAKLKHQARAAITAWRQRTGASILLLPSVVGQVTVPDGSRNGRLISVGRKGQSDDTVIVGKDGVLWGVLFAEYKAGHDTQRHAQQQFEAKAIGVGAAYALIRAPQHMTDALDQIAAQRGRLF